MYGLPDLSLKPPIFSIQNVYILVIKCLSFALQMKEHSTSCTGPFSSAEVPTLLFAPDRIYYIAPTNSPQTEEATWMSREKFQPNKKDV